MPLTPAQRKLRTALLRAEAAYLTAHGWRPVKPDEVMVEEHHFPDVGDWHDPRGKPGDVGGPWYGADAAIVEQKRRDGLPPARAPRKRRA